MSTRSSRTRVQKREQIAAKRRLTVRKAAKWVCRDNGYAKEHEREGATLREDERFVPRLQDLIWNIKAEHV
jgi:hypothetical protein